MRHPLLFLCLLGFPAGTVYAQSPVPEKVPYSGFVELGGKAAEQAALRFELWDNPNPGAAEGKAVYCEEHGTPLVQLSDGRFQLNLGGGTAVACPGAEEVVNFSLDLFAEN